MVGTSEHCYSTRVSQEKDRDEGAKSCDGQYLLSVQQRRVNKLNTAITRVLSGSLSSIGHRPLYRPEWTLLCCPFKLKGAS